MGKYSEAMELLDNKVFNKKVPDCYFNLKGDLFMFHSNYHKAFENYNIHLQKLFETNKFIKFGYQL